MINVDMNQLSEQDVRHSAQVLPGEFLRFAETLPFVLSLFRSATSPSGCFEGVLELEANFIGSDHHNGLFECYVEGKRSGGVAT